MKVFLLFVAAGVGIYLVLKIYLYVHRQLFLSKKLKEIELIYRKLLVLVDNDLDSAIENYRKWLDGDNSIKRLYNEEELIKGIDNSKESKVHEEKMYEKFLRLRERFIGDPKKLSESIVTYQRYLSVKLKQHQDASLFINSVTSGAVNFDEMMAVAKETKVVLEESERKLDTLLS